MNIKRIVSDLKKESWYTKLDAVNRLGNITYETQDDANYVLRNLLIELESPKTVMQARTLWATNNIVKQYPQLAYKIIPHLLRLSNGENTAIKEISNELLSKPLINYAIARFSTLLSKSMHSDDYYEKLGAIINIWKMAPVDPELIDSLLPELIESITEKNHLKLGIFSWMLMESDDEKTIDEIVDLVNKVYLHLDVNAQYPPSYVKKLINSPDQVMKLVGISLIEKNPETVNNEIIEDVLKLFTSPNTDRFVKAEMFHTMGVLSQTKPYLKTILMHEVNKIINNEKEDWLLIFTALVGLYIIGEKITNSDLITHPNSLIRGIAIQLIDSRSSEKILSCFNDSHVTIYISIIDRFIKPDISDEIKLKFLNDLSNPDNYPYVTEHVNKDSAARLRDSVGEIVHSWDSEHWISKINMMNDLGNLAKNNPEYVDSSIELIIKSMEDSYGMVRAQGLWIVRAILYTSKDPFHILESLDGHLEPLLKINDPNVFVRLNYVLILRKFSEFLKGIEGCEDKLSELAGYLLYIALNDQTKIVSEVAKLILKYDFDTEVNKKEIKLDNFKEYLEIFPYSSVGIIKYLLKQNQDDEKVVSMLVDVCREYHHYSCDIFCILYGIDIEVTSEEFYEKLKDYATYTTEESQASMKMLIKMHLTENNWKVRMMGISILEKISVLNLQFIDNFLTDLINISLFDKIFEIREFAGTLLEKVNFGSPNLDRETSINYLFKRSDELLEIIKNEDSGIDEAFYALSIRNKEIDNIEHLMTVVSKYKNDEHWYRRAYAYKILENLLKNPRADHYHYEIINWCLECTEDKNPIISKISRNILEKLGRTVQPSTQSHAQDRIRRIENLLESGDWTIKVEALQSVKDFINEGHYGYLDIVMEKLDDPHWKVKNAALGILADIDPELIKPAIPKIISLLNDGDESVILKTLLTLKKFGQKDSKILEKVMPTLEKLENYGTWSIKEEIMRLKLSYYNKLRQKH
uniref:HEAT repeat protein n=1 Tax=Methanococcus maripaludis (strain C6 / ATCC BAA-1332) TaxID=444158 RepID=A9AAR5_METM6